MGRPRVSRANSPYHCRAAALRIQRQAGEHIHAECTRALPVAHFCGTAQMAGCVCYVYGAAAPHVGAAISAAPPVDPDPLAAARRALPPPVPQVPLPSQQQASLSVAVRVRPLLRSEDKAKRDIVRVVDRKVVVVLDPDETKVGRSAAGRRAGRQKHWHAAGAAPRAAPRRAAPRDGAESRPFDNYLSTHRPRASPQDYLDQVQNRTKEKRYTFDVAYDTAETNKCARGAARDGARTVPSLAVAAGGCGVARCNCGQRLGNGPTPRTRRQQGSRRLCYVYAQCSPPPRRDVYEGTIRELALGVAQGLNGTVFAYGATGSGKTHTMVGERPAARVWRPALIGPLQSRPVHWQAGMYEAPSVVTCTGTVCCWCPSGFRSVHCMKPTQLRMHACAQARRPTPA